MKSLAHNKLVRNWRGKWQITQAGEDELSGKSSAKRQDS
jgi:hypothetical protein